MRRRPFGRVPPLTGLEVVWFDSRPLRYVEEAHWVSPGSYLGGSVVRSPPSTICNGVLIGGAAKAGASSPRVRILPVALWMGAQVKGMWDPHIPGAVAVPEQPVSRVYTG